MSSSSIIVEGTLQPDGVTLRLEEKLALPPGRVTVAVQPAFVHVGSTMLETLDRIHADQVKRCAKPMTDEEMAGEISQTRSQDDETEARWQEIWSQTTSQSTDKS